MFSNQEQARVRDVVVTFAGATDLDASVGDLVLYYNGNPIANANNPTWSANGTVATFSNVNFDTLTTEAAFAVKLVTSVIDPNGGAQVTGAYVDSVALNTVSGRSSGNPIVVPAQTQNSRLFAISPVRVTSSIQNQTATSAELVLTVDRGQNTTTGSAIARADLAALAFAVVGNNGGLE